MKRRTVFWLLWWLAIPALLWWSLRETSFVEIANHLGRLTPGQVAALLVLNAAIFLTFSFRWWWILRSLGSRQPYWRLSLQRLAAFGITYFTPGPQFGGEPYQVLALRAGDAVRLPLAISSVALDKLVELIANFSFLAIGLLFVLRAGLLPGLGGRTTLPLILVVLSLPASYLFFLWRGQQPLSAGLRWMHKLAPAWLNRRTAQSRRWRGASDAISEAEGSITALFRDGPVVLLIAFLVTAVSWLAQIGEYYLALRFLGLDLQLSEAIVTLTAARVAFLLPIPAGLGTLEASQILAMQALGLNPAFGLSISLLIRTRDVLFGGIGLWFSGLGKPQRWEPSLRE